MWCEHCQTDVATEISADGQSLLCTTCGQPTRKVVAPSLHPETKSAREFLERWAKEQQAQKQQRASQTAPVAENLSTVIPESSKIPAVSAERAPPAKEIPNEIPAARSIPAPVVPTPVTPPQSTLPSDRLAEPQAVDQPATPPGKSKWRIDSQHGAPSGPLPAKRDQPRRSQRLEKIIQDLRDNAAIPPTPPVETAPVPAERGEPPMTENLSPKKRKHRLDDAAPAVIGPHFDPAVNLPRRVAFPGRSEAMWGQILAYTGVGMLTVGTVFVLWGYFGDIERYASTGWLVATAGQMLLLLGIVTLVGGGMQQTTHEVSQRIEHLGGRIIRIEQSTDKILKGPHFRRSRRRSAAGQNKEQDAA